MAPEPPLFAWLPERGRHFDGEGGLRGGAVLVLLGAPRLLRGLLGPGPHHSGDEAAVGCSVPAIISQATDRTSGP